METNNIPNPDKFNEILNDYNNIAKAKCQLRGDVINAIYKLLEANNDEYICISERFLEYSGDGSDVDEPEELDCSDFFEVLGFKTEDGTTYPVLSTDDEDICVDIEHFTTDDLVEIYQDAYNAFLEKR